jgi:RNA polymerase sigma-70 factor (ECF subfamily)
MHVGWLICIRGAYYMTERTNEQWITALSADDTPEQADALVALQQRLQRGLYYYLSRERSDLSGRSHGDLQHMVEDFSQEATLRILKNLHSFRGDSKFTTWATKVAVRVAISELRRARYRDFSLEALTIDGELMPAIDPDFGSDRPVGPEKSAERGDVLEKVQHALATSLTDRQRTALEAVGLKGIPLEIVADQMQTNRNALYKLLHDARLKLRSTLEKDGISMDYVKDLFQ